MRAFILSLCLCLSGWLFVCQAEEPPQPTTPPAAPAGEKEAPAAKEQKKDSGNHKLLLVYGVAIFCFIPVYLGYWVYVVVEAKRRKNKAKLLSEDANRVQGDV